jgi:hypothetical protein
VTEFDGLVDDAIFLAMESQARTHELWGSYDWNVDLPTQQFAFTSEPPTPFKAHLLGSSAPGPNSWLWGWANSNVAPESTALVSRARDHAATRGIAELTTPELALTDDLPLRLALAIESLTGLRTYFNGDIGRGSRIWLLLEGEALALPAPDVISVTGAITRGIAATTVHDHRRAVRSYAGHRGISLADEATMALVLPGGTVTVEFVNDRISNIHATSGPA